MDDTSVCKIIPRDDVLLVEVCKRALNGPVTNQVVDTVHTEAAAHPALPIVLDLGQVKFAPSVALGALVKLGKSFEFDGRRLGLIGVDRRVREAIQITRLDRILEIHEDLDAFLQSAKS